MKNKSPTKKQILAMCEELAESVKTEVVHSCIRYLQSGVINLEYFEDNYRLPKIMVTAAIKNAESLFRPLSKENKELAKELEKI